jgi:ethanolamine utilization protein EutQ (cupin superfamily)
MKKFALFLLIPIVAIAQNYPGMNEAEMQKMMQQMEKMQSCMEKVDKKELKALEQRSRQMEADVKSLCASGKRDEAQKKAISFGKEITNDATMKMMRKCGEIVKDMIPKMSFTGLDKDSADHHICDLGVVD